MSNLQKAFFLFIQILARLGYVDCILIDILVIQKMVTTHEHSNAADKAHKQIKLIHHTKALIQNIASRYTRVQVKTEACQPPQPK